MNAPSWQRTPQQQQQAGPTGTPEGTDPNALVVPKAAPQPPAPGTSPNAGLFTEDEVNARIESVRKEEHEKLYGRIGGLQAANNELTTKLNGLVESQQQRDAREAQERADADAAAAAEADRKEREELDAKSLLVKAEERWANQLAEQQANWQKERALQQREIEYQETQRWRAEQIANPEVAGSILPELLPLVQGATQQEIAASIATMQDRSAAILASIQEMEQSQPQQQLAPWQQAGLPARVTAPLSSPDNPTDYETLQLDQIERMSPAEYANNRDRLMAAVRRTPPTTQRSY